MTCQLDSLSKHTIEVVTNIFSFKRTVQVVDTAGLTLVSTCTQSLTPTDLIVLQCFHDFLAGPNDSGSRPGMLLVLELHAGPGDVQLAEYLLHAGFLDGLVHDVLHLILEQVQVQLQQVLQDRFLVHREAHLRHEDDTWAQKSSRLQATQHQIVKIIVEWLSARDQSLDQS